MPPRDCAAGQRRHRLSGGVSARKPRGPVPGPTVMGDDRLVTTVAPQVFGQRRDRGIACGRLVGAGPPGNREEIGGHWPARSRRRVEQFAQHEPQRIDVGGGRHVSTGTLVGRRVSRCVRLHTLRRGLARQKRDAEVEQLHLAIGRDDEVARLGGAVHDAVRMRMRQRITDATTRSRRCVSVGPCASVHASSGCPSTYSSTR